MSSEQVMFPSVLRHVGTELIEAQAHSRVLVRVMRRAWGVRFRVRVRVRVRVSVGQSHEEGLGRVAAQGGHVRPHDNANRVPDASKSRIHGRDGTAFALSQSIVINETCEGHALPREL